MTAPAGAVRDSSLGTLLLLAPFIFIAHFLEEGPGFVTWFNAHVSRGITEGLFWTVNATALVITVAVVAAEWSSARSAITAVVLVGWLSFLMFANALLHITGAIADRAYMPGLVTAVLLYLPFYLWVVSRIVRTRRLPSGVIVVTAILGALPMAMHGYLIIFRGSRLF